MDPLQVADRSYVARLPIENYDLDATLESGQAFRWRRWNGGWAGVLGSHWVQLQRDGRELIAETAMPVPDWRWLTHYLRLEEDLDAVLATFPNDPPMRAAMAACPGLRLLRQDPWECLASFILSSTKQILQIQQVVALMCERYGQQVTAPDEVSPAFTFPTPDRIAAVSEAELRDCKMGFRAPYLLAAAHRIVSGDLNLESLDKLSLESARDQLMQLPGVGRKIADCVLLFAYGFQPAFPVDVWIGKAIRQLYFPRRRIKPKQLEAFTASHFGPYAGYAQQYLFHYMRLNGRKAKG